MGHGSTVQLVPLVIGHRSRGSWVNCSIGHMGHRSRGSWVSCSVDHMGHGSSAMMLPAGVRRSVQRPVGQCVRVWRRACQTVSYPSDRQHWSTHNTQSYSKLPRYAVLSGRDHLQLEAENAITNSPCRFVHIFHFCPNLDSPWNSSTSYIGLFIFDDLKHLGVIGTF